MTVAMLVGCWAFFSLLLGFLLGRAFGSFAARRRAEEKLFARLEDLRDPLPAGGFASEQADDLTATRSHEEHEPAYEMDGHRVPDHSERENDPTNLNAHSTQAHTPEVPSLDRVLQSLPFAHSSGQAKALRVQSAALDQRLRLVTSIMHHHLAERITMSCLAGEADLSVSRLSHLFREQIGVSPKRYLKSVRLLYAMDLLRCSGLSVKQVAGQVGLGSSAFIKQFQQTYGSPPKRWRQDSRSREETGFGSGGGAAQGANGRIRA